MADTLLTKKNGAVMTLTMNRVDMRNALGFPEDADAFLEAAKEIETDQDIRCVILTGAGPAFSAGGNIKAMREKSGMFSGSPLTVAEGYRAVIHKVIRALWTMEVPLISAINGPAIGLGCDVACTGDIRICNQSAIFGATFLKLGIVPGDGGAWLLPRTIGLARAAELFFTAETINAQTALEWGLVSRVVPDDKLLEAANDIAQRVIGQPRGVLRMTKRLMRRGLNQSFDDIMEQSASMQALAHFTDDHHEALGAFFEKRPPQIHGQIEIREKIMSAVGVAVILKIKEGKEKEFEKVFAQLASQVKANESGNVFYEVMRVTDDACSYVVMEKYESEEARVAHSKSAHFIAAQPQIGPLLDGRPIVHRLVSF